MARMTAINLEIQDVIDRWMREDAGVHIAKHDRTYSSLVRALESFLMERDRNGAADFQKAVETAYQNGYNAGCGQKG